MTTSQQIAHSLAPAWPYPAGLIIRIVQTLGLRGAAAQSTADRAMLHYLQRGI